MLAIYSIARLARLCKTVQTGIRHAFPFAKCRVTHRRVRILSRERNAYHVRDAVRPLKLQKS